MKGAPLLCASLLGVFFLPACAKKEPPEQATESKTVDPPAVPENASRLSRRSAPEDVVPETLVLGQVLLDTSDPDDLIAPMAPASATQLATLLANSEWIATADEELPSARVARRVEAQLNLGCKYEAGSVKAPASLVVVAEATILFVDDGQSQLQPRAAVMIEHEFEVEAKASITIVTQDILNRALARVAESLVARLHLRQASHAELLAALSEGDQEPGLRTWALQLAAERGLREAVPAGIEALEAQDEGLRSAAIAALVEIGDPRAVSALGKGLDFKDYESVAVIVEAVSAIGGEEAVDFLEFVRSGHPSEELRTRAHEGIERIAKQRGAHAPASN